MANSDLISRKEAIETISLVLKACNPELDPIHIRVLSSAIHLLEDEPVVDAAPIIHAQWVPESDRTNHWHCGNCGFVEGIVSRFYNYCPNCGAKIDLEEQEARQCRLN